MAKAEEEKMYSATNSSANVWIMKPVGMSRGRGIELVSDISCLTYSQATVVQRYIPYPMCLDGYKFDLRLYVLVSSFRPLEAFIYGDGFARISTQKYSLDADNVQNKFIHLTNSSIQRQNVDGPTHDNPLAGGDNDSGGSKISLNGDHGLWARLKRHSIDTDGMWTSIKTMIIKSLVVVDDKMTYQPNAFEVFGYDVLLDSECRPWLIEANASPSMSRDSQLDYRIKDAMIHDTIALINPLPFDRAAVARIMKRRMRDVATSKFVLARSDPQLETDLREMLGDKRPRKVGEEPAQMGCYEWLAPNTKEYEKVIRLKNKVIKEKN
jgi:tubulin polyglutamylase TTLL5